MTMDKIQNKLDDYAKKNDTDIIAYFGDISRGQDEIIINEL